MAGVFSNRYGMDAIKQSFDWSDGVELRTLRNMLDLDIEQAHLNNIALESWVEPFRDWLTEYLNGCYETGRETAQQAHR